MKRKTYLDTLYYVFFGSYFALCLAMSTIIVILHVDTLYLCLGWFYIVLIFVMAYFFYFRSYAFYKKNMIVNLGFFRIKYKYSDMKKCFITSNLRTSYATSKKRICIKFKKKEIYISPESMDEVLFLLIKRMGENK